MRRPSGVAELEDDSMMPKVSVIMACYNHAEYVGSAIQSILDQTFRDFELIVVDDGSSDGSGEVIEQYAEKGHRVRHLTNERNMGMVASKNRALYSARGEYVGICDSDDIWLRDKLESQVPILEENPKVVLVYSDAEIMNREGSPTGRRWRELSPAPRDKWSGELNDSLLIRNFICLPTVVFRRSCVASVGPFDRRFRWGSDWMYWIKLSKLGSICYIERPLAMWRYTGQNMSMNIRPGERRAFLMNYALFRATLLREFPSMSRTAYLHNLGKLADLCHQLGLLDIAQRLYLRLMIQKPSLQLVETFLAVTIPEYPFKTAYRHLRKQLGLP